MICKSEKPLCIHVSKKRHSLLVLCNPNFQINKGAPKQVLNSIKNIVLNNIKRPSETAKQTENWYDRSICQYPISLSKCLKRKLPRTQNGFGDLLKCSLKREIKFTHLSLLESRLSSRWTLSSSNEKNIICGVLWVFPNHWFASNKLNEMFIHSGTDFVVFFWSRKDEKFFSNLDRCRHES